MEKRGVPFELEILVIRDGEVLNIVFPDLRLGISIDTGAVFIINSHSVVKVDRERVPA